MVMGSLRCFDPNLLQWVLCKSTGKTMLGPWKRVLTGSTKHFVSASRRGVEHARLGRKANDRAYSSGRGLLIDNSLSVQQFLVYGAIGVGISGALYLWKQSQEEPKSDLVTPVLVAKDVPVLGGLSKNSTYIVGDCVMTGKMDEDPMVVPHQVRFKAFSAFAQFRGPFLTVYVSPLAHSCSQRLN